MSEENDLSDKANFYLDKKISVHIETYNDRFYNGILLEVGNKHLILHDRKIGEIFINFGEIRIFEKDKEVWK